MRFPVLSEVKLSFVPQLIVDDISIAVVPSIQCAVSSTSTSSTSSSVSTKSKRDFCFLCTFLYERYEVLFSSFIPQFLKNVLAATSSDTADNETSQNLKATVDHAVEMKFTDCETSLAEFCNASTQIEDCIGCKSCYNKNRILKNKVIDLKAQLQDKNKTLSHMKKGSYCGLIVRANKKKSYPSNPLMFINLFFYYFFKGIKSYYYSWKKVSQRETRKKKRKIQRKPKTQKMKMQSLRKSH